MAIMIQVSELSLSSVEGQFIFKDLHFRLNRGEWGCIAGQAKSGKTLLLKLLTGQCIPDRGQILVDDRNILRINQEKLRQLRRRLGIALADPVPLGGRSLRECMIFKQRALDETLSDATQRAEQIFEQMGLQKKADELPEALSAVERELFSLGLTLSHDPVLLLLDDPLRAISSATERDRYFEVLERIHLRKRLTTLMTSAPARFPERLPIVYFDLVDGSIQERLRDRSNLTAEISQLEEVG